MIVELIIYERDDGPIPKHVVAEITPCPRIGERVIHNERRFTVKMVTYVLDASRRGRASAVVQVHCDLDE